MSKIACLRVVHRAPRDDRTWYLVSKQRRNADVSVIPWRRPTRASDHPKYNFFQPANIVMDIEVCPGAQLAGLAHHRSHVPVCRQSHQRVFQCDIIIDRNDQPFRRANRVARAADIRYYYGCWRGSLIGASNARLYFDAADRYPRSDNAFSNRSAMIRLPRALGCRRSW